MTRTRRRPLPSHQVEPERAVIFGLVLGVLSFAVMAWFVNLTAAFLTLLAIAFYVVVYTILLKRSTPQNIVIGGAAGALPPVIGWAAVTGSVGLPALVLFALVFYWTPPHFWALSLRIRKDYAAAGVPMLPVVKGIPETTRQIGLYTVLMVAISLILFAVARMGAIYLGTAIVLGAIFLWQAYGLWRRGSSEEASTAGAIRLYKYSISYLSAAVPRGRGRRARAHPGLTGAADRPDRASAPGDERPIPGPGLRPPPHAPAAGPRARGDPPQPGGRGIAAVARRPGRDERSGRRPPVLGVRVGGRARDRAVSARPSGRRGGRDASSTWRPVPGCARSRRCDRAAPSSASPGRTSTGSREHRPRIGRNARANRDGGCTVAWRDRSRPRRADPKCEPVDDLRRRAAADPSWSRPPDGSAAPAPRPCTAGSRAHVDDRGADLDRRSGPPLPPSRERRSSWPRSDGRGRAPSARGPRRRTASSIDCSSASGAERTWSTALGPVAERQVSIASRPPSRAGRPPGHAGPRPGPGAGQVGQQRCLRQRLAEQLLDELRGSAGATVAQQPLADTNPYQPGSPADQSPRSSRIRARSAAAVMAESA